MKHDIMYCADYAQNCKQFNNTGAETCICCGAVIPEGRQICPICERNLVNSMPNNTK